MPFLPVAHLSKEVAILHTLYEGLADSAGGTIHVKYESRRDAAGAKPGQVILQVCGVDNQLTNYSYKENRML